MLIYISHLVGKIRLSNDMQKISGEKWVHENMYGFPLNNIYRTAQLTNSMEMSTS
jgi:hypothetical protein